LIDGQLRRATIEARPVRLWAKTAQAGRGFSVDASTRSGNFRDNRGMPRVMSAGSLVEECAAVQIAITCRHGSLRDEVHDHLAKKCEKLLTYFERVTAIQVTVDFEKVRTRVEIHLDAEHRSDFVSHDEGDDVVATFDSALHKMEQQIKKYKQKIQDHRRDVPMNELVDGDAALE
jgi:putative sigma-54 modulation protein